MEYNKNNVLTGNESNNREAQKDNDKKDESEYETDEEEEEEDDEEGEKQKEDKKEKRIYYADCPDFVKKRYKDEDEEEEYEEEDENINKNENPSNEKVKVYYEDCPEFVKRRNVKKLKKKKKKKKQNILINNNQNIINKNNNIINNINLKSSDIDNKSNNGPREQINNDNDNDNDNDNFNENNNLNINEIEKNNDHDDIKNEENNVKENENEFNDKGEKIDSNTCDKDKIEQNVDKNQICQNNDKNENNKENEENKIIEEEENKEIEKDLKSESNKNIEEEKETEEKKDKEKEEDLIENKDSIKEKKDEDIEKDNKLNEPNIPSQEQEISENKSIIDQPNDNGTKETNENIEANQIIENNTSKPLYEIHANQMSIITEVKNERKNPLIIFESKTEEENNISQKDINENSEDDKKENASEKILVNKELFSKIKRPNLPKKGAKRIVKADGASFTIDKNKNKKVKRYFTSDFLSLNRRNKTPDKKVLEDLEKIKNKIRKKKEQELKEKNLKKNRALHHKIMSDIIDKNKIKEKKIEELKKENDESNSETEEDEEQKQKLAKYGSIFEDLLKVNIKINQIIKKKKEKEIEKLENMNKSDGETDPYAYLYNSYGFPRTNASFIPAAYLKKEGNKKVSKVKTSKAKIVNFYETVRAATSEYNFRKYKNSLTKSIKTRPNEDQLKDKKPKYKRKNCSSIDLDSFTRNNKSQLADKGYNKNIYSTNTHKSKKSNYPKEINNIKKSPKSFLLKTEKKMKRFSNEQSSLNKRKAFENSYNNTNPKKYRSKFESKIETKPKIDKYDDIDNSENRIVDDDNDEFNNKNNDLEEIKRNFKNKLISITNDLSDMKDNEESSVLLYYKGPIDIKNISLFNYKETILNMKNKMIESGFEMSKIKENIFKFSKENEIFIIQIVKIQSEMLYYLITKENKSNE